jgi:DnaJ family protein B protein 4
MGGMGGMGGRPGGMGGMGGGFPGMGGGGGGGGGPFGGGHFGAEDAFPGMGAARPPPPRRAPPPPPERVEVPLDLALEELFAGATKRRRVTRRIVDAASGRALPVEETLEIAVKPGWKAGTRVTFEGKGDERPGRPPQDLVFVVRQLPHARFKREGDDLVTTACVPLAAALTAGAAVEVRALDGRALRLPLREVARPGAALVARGEGMPVSKRPGERGDLRVKLEVDFPKLQLAGEEAAALQRLLAGK